MRLAALYLRSRRAGRAALTLLAVAPVAWALTWLLVSQTPYGVGRGGLTLLLVFGSLAVACVVGASAGSPFDEAERVTARPLSPLRLGHLVGLLLCSAFFLSVALLAFDLEGARPAYPLLVLLRNLAGLVGLALLAAGVAGARLSWVPPFALALAYLTLAGSSSGVLSSWAMGSRHGLHGPSWAVALASLIAGLAVVCLYGVREPAGEIE